MSAFYRKNLEPKNHFDCGYKNESGDVVEGWADNPRRFLLVGRPQIGKTGAFLWLIYRMWQGVRDAAVGDILDAEESEEKDDEIDPNEVDFNDDRDTAYTGNVDDDEIGLYPSPNYFRTATSAHGRSKHFDSAVGAGKYSDPMNPEHWDWFVRNKPNKEDEPASTCCGGASHPHTHGGYNKDSVPGEFAASCLPEVEGEKKGDDMASSPAGASVTNGTGGKDDSDSVAPLATIQTSAQFDHELKSRFFQHDLTKARHKFPSHFPDVGEVEYDKVVFTFETKDDGTSQGGRVQHGTLSLPLPLNEQLWVTQEVGSSSSSSSSSAAAAPPLTTVQLRCSIADDILRIPIFMPSGGRHDVGKLCLEDAMKDRESGARKEYAQIVCVKASEADAYRKAWPRMPLFLLPESANNLGNHASRYWIHRLAVQLCPPDFPYYFTMDDSLHGWWGVTLPHDQVEMFGRAPLPKAQKDSVPLWDVLRHYTANVDFLTGDNGLKEITALGFGRESGRNTSTRAYARKQVYSATIWNLRQLEDNGWFFNPDLWLWGDLDINNRISHVQVRESMDHLEPKKPDIGKNYNGHYHLRITVE